MKKKGLNNYDKVIHLLSVTRVQILDEAVYISLCANTFWKGMKPSVFSPAIGKW